MMKTTKKIFALLLTVIMVLSLSIGAFAATITIIRDGSYDGQGTRTYKVYKVFDADTTINSVNDQSNTKKIYVKATEYDANTTYYTYNSTDKVYETATVADATAFAAGTFYTVVDDADTKIAYTMATNSPWLSVMRDSNQVWFDVKLAADNSKYVITLKDGVTNDDTTAKAIANYLNSHIPTGLAPTTTIDATQTGGQATVDPGYYLIVASDGAPVVTLVTADATIIEKNPYISTGKTAEEAAYQIGDFVKYTATVKIPEDTALTIEFDANGSSIPTGVVAVDEDLDVDGYVDGHGPIILHDTMGKGLTFVNVSDTTDPHAYSAKIGSDAFTAYTLTTNTETTDPKCTFHISIDVTADLLGKTIEFTYYAEVNQDAQDETGLINKLNGEHNGYKTNPDNPTVYTFDLDVKKVFQGSTAANLTATFELRTVANDASTALNFTKDANGNYIVVDSSVTPVTADNKVITLVNGTPVNILGLKDITYYLVETGTSTGYNLLSDPVEVIIVDTTTGTSSLANQQISQMVLIKATEYDANATYYTLDSTTDPNNPTWVVATGVTSSNYANYYIDTDDVAFTIENIPGVVLPSTGGIGTTIFYIVGGLLVLGAVVVLVTKRRMSAER